MYKTYRISFKQIRKIIVDEMVSSGEITKKSTYLCSLCVDHHVNAKAKGMAATLKIKYH